MILTLNLQDGKQIDLNTRFIVGVTPIKKGSLVKYRKGNTVKNYRVYEVPTRITPYLKGNNHE